MKITIKDLFEARENLPKLAGIQDVPVKIGYWIAKLVRKLNEPLRDAEAARNNLVKKYSIPPEEEERQRLELEGRLGEIEKKPKSAANKDEKKLIEVALVNLKSLKNRVLDENLEKFSNELSELTREEVDIDIDIIKLPNDIKLPDASVLIGIDNFFEIEG
jgi:hypothetical protein